MPEGVDWWFYRLLTSARLTVTRPELETAWSLDDFEETHAVLDALDAAEAKATPD